MSEDKKSDLDADRIMMTIDHIGETIDALTNILGRLRSYVDHHAAQSKADTPLIPEPAARGNRTRDNEKLREEYFMRVKKSRRLH